jgi:hypothetical protein
VLGGHVLALDPSSKDDRAAAVASAAPHASSRPGQPRHCHAMPCSIYPIFWQARHSILLHLLLYMSEHVPLHSSSHKTYTDRSTRLCAMPASSCPTSSQSLMTHGAALQSIGQDVSRKACHLHPLPHVALPGDTGGDPASTSTFSSLAVAPRRAAAAVSS